MNLLEFIGLTGLRPGPDRSNQTATCPPVGVSAQGLQ